MCGSVESVIVVGDCVVKYLVWQKFGGTRRMRETMYLYAVILRVGMGERGREVGNGTVVPCTAHSTQVFRKAVDQDESYMTTPRVVCNAPRWLHEGMNRGIALPALRTTGIGFGASMPG